MGKQRETVSEVAPEVTAAAVTEVVPEEFITGLNAITGTNTRRLLRAFEVEYPGCLIGKQVIIVPATADIATDAEDACRKYRESCGMTSNSRPPVVVGLPLDCAAAVAAIAAWDARAEKK